MDPSSLSPLASPLRIPGRLPSLRQCHLQSGQVANPIPADGDLVPDPSLPVRGGASVSGWGGAGLARVVSGAPGDRHCVRRFVRCLNATAEVRLRTFLSPCVDDCGPYGQCKLLRTHNYLYAACECKAGERSGLTGAPTGGLPGLQGLSGGGGTLN